tara:strand:+ start:452 stop:3562 length:3111 start_codon:yes stop_codon:yes gene_type:complete
MPVLADFKLQAYLLANAQELIDIMGRTKASNLLGSGGAYIKSPYCRKAVSAPSQKPLDNNSTIANSLTDKDKIHFIPTLPGFVRSKLTPYFKIYKTFVEEDTGMEADLQLLTRNYSKQISFTNPGVSVENIELVRLGGNPAEIDTNITVRLDLYAQKIGHFFDRFTDSPLFISENKTKNDLKPETRAQIDRGVSWSDLLKIDLDEVAFSEDDPRSDRQKEAAIFDVDTVKNLFEDFRNGNYYDDLKQRIKLEIGYNKVAQSVLDGFSSDHQEEIKNMIAAQKQVFYLNLVQNEISYNERQGTNITVNFVAASGLSTNTRKSDLFFDPYLYEEELRLNDLRSKIQKNLAEKPDDPIEAFIVDPFSALDRDEDIDPLQQAADRGVLGARGRRRGQDIPDPNFSKYYGGGKVDALTTIEEKKAALDIIQTTQDNLRKIQKNLLINGLYAFACHRRGTDYSANNDESARTGITNFLGNEAQSHLTRDQLKSRAYVHFARYEDVLNKVSNKLSTKNKDGTGDPIILDLATIEDRDHFRNYGAISGDLGGGLTGLVEDFAINPSQERTDEEVLETINSGGTGNRNELEGDEVDIEFTFFGDIIDVALEIIASNNRTYDPGMKTEDRLFKKSKDLLYTGLSADSVAKTAFVKPFYFDVLSHRVDYRNASIRPNQRLEGLYNILGEIIHSEIVYANPADPGGEPIKINLADVPISMIEYKKWFATNIGGTRRTNFFIGNFIKQMLNWLSGLIADAVNYDKSRTSSKEPPELTMNKFFANKDDSFFLLNLTPNANRIATASQNLSNNSYGAISLESLLKAFNEQDVGKPNPKTITLISQTPELVLSRPTTTTRKARDLEKNIPHVSINNATAGALITARFSREDMPGLREARLFEGENFRNQSLLREKYNSTLELNGNTFFKPGTVFYIEPGQLDLGYTDDAVSYAQQLGLGGYFVTIRVEHQLFFGEKLQWITIVSSKWKSFGNSINVDLGYDRKGVTSFLARRAMAFDTDTDEGKVALDRLFADYYIDIARQTARNEREEGTD